MSQPPADHARPADQAQPSLHAAPAHDAGPTDQAHRTNQAGPTDQAHRTNQLGPTDPAGPAVRAAEPSDEAAVAAIHQATWGGNVVAGHGTLFHLDRLPTLVAVDGAVVGALAYQITGDDLEIVSIAADPPGRGTGTALLRAAVGEAERRGLRRVWLITTNDNLDALRFYQRRGMRIASVRTDAVALSRSLKPGIPDVGAYGIPIRDEIVLEVRLPDEPGGRRDDEAARRRNR